MLCCAVLCCLQFTAEATPYYIMDPGALRRIRAMVPHAKLIVCVRDPVARFFSQYVHPAPTAYPHMVCPPLSTARTWHGGIYGHAHCCGDTLLPPLLPVTV